jgi:hypothetical protein
MLRQGDADVFKRYSQAKLGMMREALANSRPCGMKPETERALDSIIEALVTEGRLEMCG